MKKFKEFTSVVLTGAMVLSMTGCAFLSSSRIGPRSIAKYAQDQGSDCYEQDDFMDMLDELNEQEQDEDDSSSGLKKLKNGVYIELDSKGLKTYFKKSEVGETARSSFEYDKSMTSGTVYYLGGEKNNKRWALQVFSIEFETEDDAEDYFDEATESIEEGFNALGTYMTTDTDDGEEDDGISYFAASAVYSGTASIYEAIYRDGKNVMVVLSADVGGSSGEDAIEDFCEAMNVTSPTDI